MPTFLSPPEIRFGPGESRSALDIARRFGSRVFLLTGGRSFESLPVAATLSALPRAAVSGEPDVASLDDVARRVREAGADVVLAVGGGSVLDTAKAAAALAANPGSVRDYLEGVGSRALENPPLPIVAVPTTAGSGSEATKNAVVRVPDLRVKRSIRHDRMLPRAAIVDPDLSSSAPVEVAASAGLDALTHLIEGYVSTGAHAMTDALARPGMRLAAQGLRALAETGRGGEAMTLASLWGGMVLANAGLGAVHGLVAPLGGRCAIPHGMGCACLLVETQRANLAALRARAPGGPALARYGEVAEALGAASFEAALDELESLRDRLKVPGLARFGVTQADVAPLVKDSRGSSMRTNPVVLTDEELSGVLDAVLRRPDPGV